MTTQSSSSVRLPHVEIFEIYKIQGKGKEEKDGFMSRLTVKGTRIYVIIEYKMYLSDKDPTLLNIDFRYFPEPEHSEHWQWILFDFLVAARHNFVIVYGTIGRAIIVNMNIGNSALFSSEAAILTFGVQQLEQRY